RQFGIDHHHLAVQPAKQVGAHAHEFRARVKQLNLHPGADHFLHERRTQVAGAVVIHRNDYAYAAAGRLDHRLLQAFADAVFENDERLDQYLSPRRANV
nr:hypothetical protein [Tanacetum cinerariifolium]